MGCIIASKTLHPQKVVDQLEEEEKMVRPGSSIATNWRELSGQHHWKDLLDPLDIDLRKYIIHYGEMAQATYDAFISDKTSKYAGRSRYGKTDFFSKVGLENGNPFKYEVTKFLYATLETGFPIFGDHVEESSWIGYVAVATDEGKAVLGRRDIVIAWRRTDQITEWIKDFQFFLSDAPYIFGHEINLKVHRGFYSIYTAKNSSALNRNSVRTEVLTEVRRLVNKFKDEQISITITGHSLGAALATLNALDIVANGFNIQGDGSQKACLVTAFVFASPRVGDSKFSKFFTAQKDLRTLRVRNKEDIVPSLPFLHYAEVGEELEIDIKKSNFIKHVGGVNFKMWHNLELHLHGIAGTQGRKGGFKLEVKRDIALVNKSLDALKNEYHIPKSWRIDENKGLVQQPDGTWKMQGPDSDEGDDFLINQ